MTPKALKTFLVLFLSGREKERRYKLHVYPYFGYNNFSGGWVKVFKAVKLVTPDVTTICIKFLQFYLCTKCYLLVYFADICIGIQMTNTI